MLQSNQFSFYFQMLSLKFVEILAVTRGVSPSIIKILRPPFRIYVFLSFLDL
jgi:hypothetical protein